MRELPPLLAGVALFSGIDALVGAILGATGLRFPSFVAGMVVLFLMLGLARRVRSDLVDRFNRWCAPAAGFLSRWMALFFVPPLVLVPGRAAPERRDLVLLLVLGAAGFVASFGWAGLVARVVGAGGAASAEVARGARPGWSRRTILLGWSAVGAVSLSWALAVPSSFTARVGFGVALSVVGFCVAEQLRELLLVRGWRAIAAFSHPVLLGALFIAFVWRVCGWPLSEYLPPPAGGSSAGGVLTFLLRPAVVSLALALDAQRRLIRTEALSLFLATGSAAVFSLFGTALAARWCALSPAYARAIVSRSVTTPVALSMAEMLGADRGITAMIVIVTGVLGALFAAPLGRRFGFDSPLVLGIATGASSHGIGTAGLVKHSQAAAAFSGIAFALMAVFSVLLVSSSWVRELLLSLL